MSEAMRLYGTEVPDMAAERITLGALSFTLQNGALRHIRLGDQELVRSVAFLVRDRDWGTLAPVLTEVSREVGAALRLRMEAVYETGTARLDVDLLVTAEAGRLRFEASGRVQGDFETNRAGFTVLHPASAAGAPVRVRHSDGRDEQSAFPELIAPWQPFMDITELTHRAGGLDVRCAFEGDTFEMEDQRQWGDASFKTYNRPLALPWPYTLEDGAVLRQAVDLTWSDAESRFEPMPPESVAGATFPEMALVVTAEEARALAVDPEALVLAGPQRVLCSLDTALGDTAGQLAAFAALQARGLGMALDLELIAVFDGPPGAVLGNLADEMAQAGFVPDSVLVCPSVDRQSTPPGSDWPECPPLEEIHAAAAAAFPDLPRGGGMVSFFPELNRKRPPVDRLDFVSHGLCPIVHAADDVSVMETLEAIPHITRSARAILKGTPYRIGPSTIAMRHNPYGSRTIPNPEQGRVCMSDDDPRHRGAFGAAYVIGLAAALAPADVTVWTPAAVLGPRGLDEDWPIGDALLVLADLAGQPVEHASVNDGLARLTVGGTTLTANLTASGREGLGPYEWSVT
ncbi:hypothetical protein ACN2XU_07235 [Primorskyibacter sp. 2E107]|uniref:hypothetical protein n=1 Tax=Primorskyibacter sp. 2E107 TaxID=3403458 RepID=UPI003AF6A03D